MKKKLSLRDVVFIIAAASLAVGLCVYAFAAGGTKDDPLVTLGYIEGPYKQSLRQSVMDDIDEEFFADLKDQIGREIRANVSDLLNDFTVVELDRGDSIEAAGSMELVLRTGQATAFVKLQENINAKVGLSDLTTGKEVVDGESLSPNHYVIISRGDGRGVSVTSEKCWFMVRGSYNIVKAGD